MTRDLRPVIVVAVAVIYSVTVIVGTTVVLVVNTNNNSVAKACIEAQGQWVVTGDGTRECRRP